MLVIPNVTHRFKAIPVKTPASYFMDINKYYGVYTKMAHVQEYLTEYLKGKNKVGELTLPEHFKTYYRV